MEQLCFIKNLNEFKVHAPCLLYTSGQDLVAATYPSPVMNVLYRLKYCTLQLDTLVNT